MKINERYGNRIVFETSIGAMGLFYSVNPFMIRRILLPGQQINELSEALLPDFSDKGRGREKANQAVQLIRDAIKGGDVDIPWGDMLWDGVTDLQKAVYRQTAKIPYGSLATYKDIARRIRRPNACRFVGTALAKNPFPVLIPCHRVIRSDNKIGGFGGGTKLKERLIHAEASGSFLRT